MNAIKIISAVGTFEFSGVYTATLRADKAVQKVDKADIARADGSKVTGSKIDSKGLTLEGKVICHTRADLEAAIDTLRKFTIVTNAILVVPYAGGYRRYNVDNVGYVDTTDNGQLTFCTFNLDFEANEPPFGLQCDSNGNVIKTTALIINDNTSDLVASDITLDGTASPTPRVVMEFEKCGDVTSLDVVNQSTGHSLTVTDNLADGDIVVVDTDNKKVTKNNEELDFSGAMPLFLVGLNKLLLNLYSISSGAILMTSQIVNNGSKPFWGSRKLAQSFQPDTNCGITKLALLLSKVGNIDTDITVSIYTDNNGVPGSLVTSASLTIPGTALNNLGTWVLQAFEGLPYLTASTTYHLVVETTGGDVNNYYNWHLNTLGGYDLGAPKQYTASTWQGFDGDLCFKIFKNLVGVSNAEVPLIDNSYTRDVLKTSNANYTNTIKLVAGTAAEVAALSNTYDNGVSPIVAGNNAAVQGWARVFVATASTVVRRVEAQIQSVGYPTDELELVIYKGDGGTDLYKDMVPMAVIQSDYFQYVSNMGYFEVPYEITDENISFENGQTYTILLRRTGETDSSNYYNIGRASNTAGGLSENYIVDCSQGVDQAVLNHIDSNMPPYFKVTGNTYDTTKNIFYGILGRGMGGTSNLLRSLTATLDADLPTGCSIAIALCDKDGNYTIPITSGVEFVPTPGDQENATLKYKLTLTGTTIFTPVIRAVNAVAESYNKQYGGSLGIYASYPHFVAKVGKVSIYMDKIGSCAGTLTCSIKRGTSSPVTLATSTINVADITGEGWVTFDFEASRPQVYDADYIRIDLDNTLADASNCALVLNNHGGYAFELYKSLGEPPQVNISVEYTKRYL